MKVNSKEKIANNKREILITGTSICRGIQVVVALYLLYSLYQTFVFGKVLDTTLFLMMSSSLLTLELALSSKKENKPKEM